MGKETGISWTHHTFNPWRGCTKVSPGCANCYAETLSRRNPKVLGKWGPNGVRIVGSESYWREPVKWNKAAEKAGERRRVFCASLADVFERYETMPPEFVPVVTKARVRLFDTIRLTPHLDWLLLTKRPENWQRCLRECIDLTRENDRYDLMWPVNSWMIGWLHGDSPHFGHVIPPNVWLGVSVEDQKRADERIPRLLQIPAAVRFLSCEPLLGPLDLTSIADDELNAINALTGNRLVNGVVVKGSAIDWVIAGGESGSNARPFKIEWARWLVQQCKDAYVACFVKQLGSLPMDHSVHREGQTVVVLKDSKGENPSEWPDDLRVREYPADATIRS